MTVRSLIDDANRSNAPEPKVSSALAALRSLLAVDPEGCYGCMFHECHHSELLGTPCAHVIKERSSEEKLQQALDLLRRLEESEPGRKRTKLWAEVREMLEVDPQETEVSQ